MTEWTWREEERFCNGADGHQPVSWFAHDHQIRREAAYICNAAFGGISPDGGLLFHLLVQTLSQHHRRNTDFLPASIDLILSECDEVARDRENRLLEEGWQLGLISGGTPYVECDREVG